jgi:phosphoesterase RecJ-like protein
MASIRTKRVAEQIQEEISSMLLRGLKDPRIGFVTITDVEISPDFSKAWVYFCTTGSEAERDQSQEGLQSAASYIRKTLGKRLRLKLIPELEFRYDTSLDRGDRIEQILGEVREKEGWDDPTRVRGSAEEVAAALQASSRVLVASHANPDGDAIGSILAMGRLLEKLGKDVVVYVRDAVPGNFRFLPGADRIRHSLEDQEPFDTTVILDCSELERVGGLPPADRMGRLIGIDHHLTTKPLGETHLLDPAAAAIGELIYQILLILKVDLDYDLAVCIYTTLLTDTGSFRYSNTSPRALHTAAEMVAQGVSPWEVALAVYESQPLARLNLLALVLPTLRVDPTGRYGTITITQAMFEQTATGEEHIDGFINFPRGIEGIEVAVQYRQVGSERFKVSFRSRGNVNVAEIASLFAGGGHANAAGCALDGSLEAVQARIERAVEQALEEALDPADTE